MLDPQYAWYFKALEVGGGRQLSKDQQRALGVTHEPQSGFYRKRNKNGPDVPVAIWNGEMGLVAVAGDNPADPVDIWTWVCSWPITEAAYRDVAENGAAWADDAPVAVATIGHNQPDDPHEALKVEFAGEQELAEQFLKAPITTQEQADRAAVWSKKLSAIAKKATDLHKVEKQPHLDAGRGVDDKWRSLKEDPDALSKRLKRHMDAYLLEQQRIERERQEAARREEERLRREAEEVARKAAEDQQQSEHARAAAQAEVEQLRREAEEKAKEAEARNASAGRTGAKVSLRTFVSAEITDYDALVVALKDRPEVREIVQSLANRAAKSGVDLPGMKIVEERRAA